MLRPGGILVSAGRGALADHDALVTALRSGRLEGAGLDVFWQEPVDPADPVLAENVSATPHVGGVTTPAYRAAAQRFAANVERLRQGRAAGEQGRVTGGQRMSGHVYPGEDAAQARIGGVAVPPGDVAADHAALLAVGGVVGAVEGELAQRGELAFKAVHPRGVRGRAGDLDVLAAAHCPTCLSFLVVRCGL